MKKSTLLIVLIVISSLGGMLYWYLKNDQNIQPIANVPAPASWFTESTTAAPNDHTPFLSKHAPNEVFHLWAWQKFLSLTRSANKIAPFQEYVQVNNNLVSLGDTIELSDSTQAGTNGVLYDSTAANRAIYYTIHVNQKMFDFQQEYLPKFTAIYNQYKGSASRDAQIQQQLNALGYNKLSYPEGCVELKTSWILADSLKEGMKEYYTTWAKMTTANGTSVVKVALLGMHIIGTVANHPEFIWSTFEHDNLMPDYKWDHAGYPLLGDTLSDKNFLFYKKNNVIGNCLMNNNPATFSGFYNCFNIYPLGIARSFTSNAVPTERDLSNNAGIVSLNANVKRALAKKKEVWQHYFYKGAIWLDYPNNAYKPGNGYLGLLSVKALNGTRALSNNTMETFSQLNFSGNYTTGSMNCFGCHGTIDYKNVQPNTNDSLMYNLALSHLFKNAILQVAADTLPKVIVPKKGT